MAKQFKSKYTGAQIDKAVGDVLEGRVCEVPAERKVGGVNLENDTANLQDYTWAEGQTMAQKISAMDQAINGKQAKIDAEHKLSQELVEGLTDNLANKVEKTTEIGGVQIDNGIDTVQDLIYSQEEVTTELPFEEDVFYNVRMSDIDVEFPSEITKENADIATSHRIWLGFYNYTYHDTDYIVINYYDDNEGGLDLYYHPSWNKWVDEDGNDYEGDPLTYPFSSGGVTNAEALDKILIHKTETETVTKTLKDKFEEIPSGSDLPLADQIYDTVAEEVEVKINLVDNETYKFKKTYNPEDFASFDFGINYGKMESGNPTTDVIILQNVKYPVIQFSPFEYVDLEHQRYTKYYIYQPDSPTTCHWFEMVWDDNENDYISTSYDGDIKIVYNSENALTTPDLFSQTVLDLTKTETILEPRTLKQKIEDLRNWKYDEKIIPATEGLVDGKTYTMPLLTLAEYTSLAQYANPQNVVTVYGDTFTTMEDLMAGNLNGIYLAEFIIYCNDKSIYAEGNIEGQDILWYDILSQEPTPHIGDIDFTYDESLVVIKEAFDIILRNYPTEEQVVDISLDEHLKGYPDWEFENAGIGILDKPLWDTISAEENYYFYYDSTAKLEIQFVYNQDYLSYNIRDWNDDTEKYYRVFDREYTIGKITFNPNTWYVTNYSMAEAKACDTPTYILDESKISTGNTIYKELFDALYNERIYTLKEKIESLENSESSGPLKDQEYGEEKTVNPTSSFDYGAGKVSLRYSVNFGENLNKVILNTNDIVYESDDLLVTYYYRSQMVYPSGIQQVFSGFLIYTSPEETSIPYDYQIINRNNATNKWAGITGQDDCPLLEVSSNEQWSNCLKYLPIAQQESAPYYGNCYNISGYEEVSNQPAFWALTYTSYYYYDNDNQEYVKFSWSSDTPEFSAQTVYKPTFSSLRSQPTDWANIYYNGNYYYGTWDGSYGILNSLLCRVNITTPTLGQKFASEKQSGLYYQTTLPEGPNTNGLIKVVVCNEEPEYKYEGYMYIVIEN